MLRARDLGIPLEGICGKYNGITDVKGVLVGYSTIIEGEPDSTNTSESNFARTGVTCILPRGKSRSAVLAGEYALNGNGELTGCHWVEDSGFLHGPIMITNTNSVGIVRDTVSKWMIRNEYFFPTRKDGVEVKGMGYFYPTVGETFDGVLNNINGFKVEEKHVLEALESAASGEIKEGNVGGGTGMRCHEFKGGTGTSSRIVECEAGIYTVGVLVQANHGKRDELKIAGVPVGRNIVGHEQVIDHLSPKPGEGSIIVVVATDAPLMPWQLKKLCKRVPLGIGNLGGGCQNGSGDIFVAFSTANDNAFTYTKTTVEMMADEMIDPFYTAVVQGVEEAILNAMFAAESMVGRNNNFVSTIPKDQVQEILRKYNLLVK